MYIEQSSLDETPVTTGTTVLFNFSYRRIQKSNSLMSSFNSFNALGSIFNV